MNEYVEITTVNYLMYDELPDIKDKYPEIMDYLWECDYTYYIKISDIYEVSKIIGLPIIVNYKKDLAVIYDDYIE